jgi:predicted nuclease of predicted toxin-antitoxin system
MRLFLDAHVSGRVIARALRERGHDVRAANEEPQLDAWEDEALLDLATAERRIMITFNVKDFPRIAVEWAAAGKHHAGCLIVVGIDHSQFGLVLRVIDAALTARPDQIAWQDYTAWGTRRSAP